MTHQPAGIDLPNHKSPGSASWASLAQPRRMAALGILRAADIHRLRGYHLGCTGVPRGGLGRRRASQLLSVLFAIQIVGGMLVLPIITDRTIDRRPLLLLSSSSSALGLLCLAATPSLAWAGVVLFGLGIGGGFSVGIVLLVDVTRSRAEAARLSAMVFLLSYTFAALGPVLVGMLHDATGGFVLGFWVLIVWRLSWPWCRSSIQASTCSIGTLVHHEIHEYYAHELVTQYGGRDGLEHRGSRTAPRGPAGDPRPRGDVRLRDGRACHRRIPRLFTAGCDAESADGIFAANGIDEIVKTYQGRFDVLGPTNHFTHGHVIRFDEQDPDTATGLLASHAEVVRNDPPMWVALRYQDTYRRTTRAGASPTG